MIKMHFFHKNGMKAVFFETDHTKWTKPFLKLNILLKVSTLLVTKPFQTTET